MLALLKKEIYQFYHSAVGWVVISLFLLVLGLFLWFFPTEMNILQSGLASLTPMFIIAPWIFIFLIPAITMRSIAEEKKEGTLEFLLTKPLSVRQIILAKYFASLVLIFIALLPTLFYFFVVQYGLSNHQVDTGAFWGSYFGLFFLAAVFAAIGIFASTISKSQIIAFLVGTILSAFFFLGFDLISRISLFTPVSEFIAYLGLNFHYQSISKGVIDSRDIIYFLSLIVIFIELSVAILKSRH